MKNGKTILSTFRYVFIAAAAGFIVAFPTALLLYNLVPANVLTVLILLGCYTLAVFAFRYVIRSLRHTPDEAPDNIVVMPTRRKNKRAA